MNKEQSHTSDLIEGGIDNIAGVCKFYRDANLITRILGIVAYTGLQAIDITNRLPSAIGADLKELLPATAQLNARWESDIGAEFERNFVDGLFNLKAYALYACALPVALGKDLVTLANQNISMVTWED